jgi:three-Cys-motif partner protein
MAKPRQLFGGDWTEQKLERVRKYLAAYTKIMHKQRFRFAYIDAFAGTGYRNLSQEDNPRQLLLPELGESATQEFLDGSARIALRVTPRFTKYIFIEKSPGRFEELQKLRSEFPALASDIILVNADANAYIKDICENRRWDRHRAVLFLDGFGMEVEWKTVEAVAKTKAIDLWYLFPLGVAVNRLLRRDGKIDESIRHRLNAIFGATDWFDTFYKLRTESTIFEKVTRLAKAASFDLIGHYFVKRLKEVFVGVAENPLPLYNSRNVPLYLLCFASGSPRGAPTAIRIAQNILRR